MPLETDRAHIMTTVLNIVTGEEGDGEDSPVSASNRAPGLLARPGVFRG